VKRILISLLAIVALAAGASVATAKRGGDHHGSKAQARLFTLKPDPAGNPEGVAFDRRSRSFFVGITADGAIYRGSLKSDTVEPFIAGGEDQSAVGIKVKRGKLYVAGGATGSITVYDLATKEPVARFETGEDGFLNDLQVTRNGDVYVTDSRRPTLWHVTGEQVEAGSGTPQPLDVSEIPYETGPNDFNVNGIVAKGSRKLIVVDSNSGKLFRIELNHEGDAIESLDEITGATVPGGDGLLLDRGKLVAVQGNPAQLAFLKLRRGAREAKLVRTQTSKKLRGPSTVDRAKGLYLVVNADFTTSRKPFTVAGLPAKAKRGHGHDHGDDHKGDDHDHDQGDDDKGDDDNRGPGSGDDD
jgi:Cu-Zn family superoxide dismutase